MPPLAPLTTHIASVPFVRDLAAFGDRPALMTCAGAVTYHDLAARVADVAGRLGTARKLVLLAASNTVESVVTYLAALAAGHPILLVPGDKPDAVASAVAAYDPDVVTRGGTHLDVRREHSAHTLHRELALLLSTSGSTGSAKLVRLSHENLQANAEAIADYLGIDSGDRAATTLPMHYCYGLSVVNSHLLRGAGLILTGRSVADGRFWNLFRTAKGTSLAGVPYTFDLLDRVGFADMRLPHLRTITQAGGRLAPDRVRRYAALGRRAGWKLFVMYGQTEATARMAYLPPELAEMHAECVGVPIPGGSFRLEPVPDGTGDCELVYSGRNVMLGYAESPSDLRLGRTVDELHTGDLARRNNAGLYQIVGRRNRFTKIFGLRIDLHHVEAALQAHGHTACCISQDDRLVVAVAGTGHLPRTARHAARAAGLPIRAVRVHPLPELPRLTNGKPDYPAVTAMTRAAGRAERAPTDLRDLYARLLGRSDVTEDSTFTSLGGDSLSYVEMSIQLEQTLGHLPPDWHTTPIRDLRRSRRRHRRWIKALDTGTTLRAVSILLIVGTHATLFDIPGGAHLLLGVAGFNFARFHLTSAARADRIRGLGRSIRRIALASMVWIALVFALTDQYRAEQVLLANYLVGGGRNDFWFIETLVYVMVALLAVLALPLADRAERRLPFGLPVALLALGLLTRYDVVPADNLPTPLVAFWLFAIGWATAKATTRWQRALLTFAVAATVPGFHGDLGREAVIIAGLLLLVWVPTIPSLRVANHIAGVLAASSLYIYLTHWQVYRPLAGTSAVLATAAALAVGIGYATLATRAAARLSRRRDYPTGRST